MIKQTLRASAAMLVFVLATPTVSASSLQYGSVNHVGPGHYSFQKAHGFWEHEFRDRWKFSVKEESKVAIAVKDFEFALGHFKLLDIQNLKLKFGEQRVREGRWLTAMLDPGQYHFIVKGDVGGLAGVYKGALKVSAVPVPATVWLFLSALAGLLVIRRKQQPQLTTA